MKKLSILRIILATLFFPFAASIIVWRKGKNYISKVLATGFTIAITLPIWLAFLLIGYNVLSGKYSNDQKPSLISNTRCSDKQVYQRNVLYDYMLMADVGIASLSAEIKQIEDITYSKPAKSIDEFRKGLPKPTDVGDEFYNATIQKYYNTYLQIREEVLTKGSANIQKTKDTYTIPKKAKLEIFTKLKNTLVPLADKLGRCQDIDEASLRQQLEKSGDLSFNRLFESLFIMLFKADNKEAGIQKLREFMLLKNTPSSMLQKNCPVSNIADPEFYTFNDISYFESELLKTNNSIASISALLEKLDNQKPPAKYTPLSFEEYKAKLKVEDPSITDDEEPLLREFYEEYKVDLENKWKKAFSDYSSSQQTNNKKLEDLMNLANSYASLYTATIAKLRNCEKVSR